MNTLLRRLSLPLLCSAVCLPSHAQEDAQARAVQFSCFYGSDAGKETEWATVGNDAREARTPRGQPRTVAFTRARSVQRMQRMEIRAGEAAECTFPSGNRIRVKVGESSASPNGRCGADPEVFMSVWVNGKKIESRRWVAGHCYRDDPGQPDLRVEYRSTASGTRVRRCESAPASAARQAACTAYPDLAQRAVDTVEYPQQASAKPRRGAIERLAGTAPVCDAAQAALADDANVFRNDAGSGKHLSFPAWTAAADVLPDDLAGAEQSVFDLNNDGRPERVLRKRFENTYMDGNVLMARYGSTAAPLSWTPASDERNLAYLPCQLADKRFAIASCPPFSQDGDEANLSLDAGAGKAPVVFRGRYVGIAPFFFRNVTYLGLAGTGQPGYAAVLEPLAAGGYRQSCLFRRIAENF